MDSQRTVPPFGASPRVLVVDDEEAVLLICREHLTKAGCEVRTATTGAEALSLLEAEAVDVLLSDYLMPAMTGAELLERVRDLYPDTVRILFTGIGDAYVAEEATGRGGAFRFLAKPFSAKSLISCVHEGVGLRYVALKQRRREEEMRRLVREQSADLAASKALLEGFLDVLPSGFLVVDGDGVISRANPAACEILGEAGRPLAGRTAAEVGLPTDLSDGSRELDVTASSGGRRTLLCSGREVLPVPDRPGYTILSFVDVTRRAELERKVSQGKRDIEAIFDSVTDPMYVVDEGGHVVRANTAFQKLVGLPWDLLVGRLWRKLLVTAGAAYAQCPVEQVLASGRTTQHEEKDQDGRIVHSCAFPIVEGHRVTGAVVRLQDVTAAREMEHRLLQSEKMASIGQLAAGVAHEINNPVGFIASGLNRLAEHAEALVRLRTQTEALCAEVKAGTVDARTSWDVYTSATAREELDFVLRDATDIVAECREGADRIRKIVSDLKTFSHPDGGEWHSFDLNQGLDSTLNIVWNELKYKCEVEKDYGDLPTVRCRPQQMNQVFLNLLVNAAQSIPERGTVRLRTWVEPDGRHVCVSVADTGVGISLADQKKIFEPFFTTKPVGKGTGLGLHLSAGIVHRHGGDIRVASQPGQGSTFTVVLPVEPPDCDEGEEER